MNSPEKVLEKTNSRRNMAQPASKLTKRDILNRYQIFDHCSEEEKKDIESSSTLMKIPPGKNVFSTGQDIEWVALLGSGVIRVYLIGDSGREITIYYVSPGESCPTNLMCAVFDRKCPSEAVTTEESAAMLIPATRFKRLMDENIGVRWAVMEGLVLRMNTIMTLVEEVTFKKMDLRLAHFLVRKLDENAVSPEGALKITHEAIARELGSAREVISRLLLDFEQKGMVARRRGGLSILDQQQLRGYT